MPYALAMPSNEWPENTAVTPLCDQYGNVVSGPAFAGQPYKCPGSFGLNGWLLICPNPVHTVFSQEWQAAFESGWHAARLLVKCVDPNLFKGGRSKEFIAGAYWGLELAADALLSGHERCANHKALDHKDGMEPWCEACSLTWNYQPPKPRTGPKAF